MTFDVEYERELVGRHFYNLSCPTEGANVEVDLDAWIKMKEFVRREHANLRRKSYY
jgi:hypothetical protein